MPPLIDRTPIQPIERPVRSEMQPVTFSRTPPAVSLYLENNYHEFVLATDIDWSGINLQLDAQDDTATLILRALARGSTQVDFLKKGVLFLKPLLQKDLASEFGVHPSTISRTIAEKFIQTPQGMFPIKFLCPRNYKGFTPARLKSMIKAIIDAEERARPLSDDAIREKLLEEGADLPRRTVAEYRSKLKIPASHAREKK